MGWGVFAFNLLISSSNDGFERAIFDGGDSHVLLAVLERLKFQLG